MKNIISTFIKLLPLLFFIVFNINLNAQPSLFSYEKYSNGKGESLNYRLLISDYDPASKYPLVIFLHGSGERGMDNEAQLKWGVNNFATDRIMQTYRPIVIAPQCPDNMSWGNYSSTGKSLKPVPSKPMRLLIELIQELTSRFPIDSDRIYITGLSMGGSGTYDAVSRYPDLFAAAVPVCGGGDVSLASTFSHIPFWIFHGVLDDAVKPANSFNMHEALMRSGAQPGLTVYPNTGHFSWIAAYSDTKMLDWLFQQGK